MIASVLLIWALAVLPSAVAGNIGANQTGVIFEDDFTMPGPFSDWPHHRAPTQDDRGDIVWSTDGGYRIRAVDSLFALAPHVERVQDVTVEVSATRFGADLDKDASWGVICRVSSLASNQYYLAILNDGTPFIAKQLDGRTTILGAGTLSEKIDKKTGRIRGDCVGSTLALYVNDHKVLEAQDGQLMSGGVGLGVEGADVVFDNFRVSNPHR